MKRDAKVPLELDALDALAVGMSLRALARGLPTDSETRAAYDRVGEQLVDAYRKAAQPAGTVVS